MDLLSPQELANVIELYDKNSTGRSIPFRWTIRELLSSMGLIFNDADLQLALNRAGNPSGNNLDFYQFAALAGYLTQLSRNYREPADKDTVDAFVAMGGNQDKSGQISVDYLRSICRKFGLTIDIDKLVSEADCDGSGVVEYTEFENMFSPYAESQKPVAETVVSVEHVEQVPAALDASGALAMRLNKQSLRLPMVPPVPRAPAKATSPHRRTLASGAQAQPESHLRHLRLARLDNQGEDGALSSNRSFFRKSASTRGSSASELGISVPPLALHKAHPTEPEEGSEQPTLLPPFTPKSRSRKSPRSQHRSPFKPQPPLSERQFRRAKPHLSTKGHTGLLDWPDEVTSSTHLDLALQSIADRAAYNRKVLTGLALSQKNPTPGELLAAQHLMQTIKDRTDQLSMVLGRYRDPQSGSDTVQQAA
eukprot:TRINITY_DN10381_c0_g1_i1.p1 TRINITY_DN10381_c0_g1~~TRINITY_DN10381_c0_g1_i1.p1  ORF type:complete len:422 (+),score=63.89 TRINITY_DN10381_c0_g1_i1:50-1315(+)